MKNALATFTILASSAMAMPQAANPSSPSAPPPPGCDTSRSGTFQLSVMNVTSAMAPSKRDVEKRQLSGTLTLSLNDSVLHDQAGRVGYIASNYQFQFDSPPQAGAIYTAGFSVCSNNSIALGGSAIFYQCWSGSFFNIYDRNWAPQCSPIYLIAQNGGGIPQIPDGQPQIPPGITVTQIPDGQPQIPTPNPSAANSTAVLVSQIPDGQPQIPTPNPTPAPSVPASNFTLPLVSQISDGQPQIPAPTNASAPYPISATPTLPRQPLGTGSGNFTPTAPTAPTPFPGAAPTASYGLGALVAAVLGAVALI